MNLENLYSVLVADDELPSRQYVCALLKQDSRFETVAVCDSGHDTVVKARACHPDIMFVDIQMPGMDGFDVIEAFQGTKPLIVFVTAHAEYAVRAFECEAFDYVKKPIDPARFARILDRLHQRLEEIKALTSPLVQAASAQIEEANSDDPNREGTKLLSAVRQDLVYRDSELRLIESAGNYVNVRIRDESYLVREPLESFCSNLDPASFVRVHRSFVVNIQWVRKMRYGKSGTAELFLADGSVIPVSRGRRTEVADILRRFCDSSEIQEDDPGT